MPASILEKDVLAQSDIESLITLGVVIANGLAATPQIAMDPEKVAIEHLVQAAKSAQLISKASAE